MFTYRIDTIKLFNKMQNSKILDKYKINNEFININYFLSNKNCYEYLKKYNTNLNIDNTLFFIYLYIQAINYLLNKNKYDNYSICISYDKKYNGYNELYITYEFDNLNYFILFFNTDSNKINNCINIKYIIKDDKFVKIYDLIEEIKNIYINNGAYMYYNKNTTVYNKDKFILNETYKKIILDASFFNDRDIIKNLFMHSIYKFAYEYILKNIKNNVAIDYINTDDIKLKYLDIENKPLEIKHSNAICIKDKKYLNSISYDIIEND